MTTYNWSALTNGQSVTFDPVADTLVINDSSISATDLSFSFSGNSTPPCTFSFGGKTITLQTAFATLTTSNITFADGSMYLIGDNTTGTANDGGANTLTGGGGDDRLIGLAGDDSMAGGAGNDTSTRRLVPPRLGMTQSMAARVLTR